MLSPRSSLHFIPMCILLLCNIKVSSTVTTKRNVSIPWIFRMGNSNVETLLTANLLIPFSVLRRYITNGIRFKIDNIFERKKFINPFCMRIKTNTSAFLFQHIHDRSSSISVCASAKKMRHRIIHRFRKNT